eukprot:1155635-Pelagomonas_calceolata.AAC.9
MAVLGGPASRKSNTCKRTGVLKGVLEECLNWNDAWQLCMYDPCSCTSSTGPHKEPMLQLNMQLYMLLDAGSKRAHSLVISKEGGAAGSGVEPIPLCARWCRTASGRLAGLGPLPQSAHALLTLLQALVRSLPLCTRWCRTVSSGFAGLSPPPQSRISHSATTLITLLQALVPGTLEIVDKTQQRVDMRNLFCLPAEQWTAQIPIVTCETCSVGLQVYRGKLRSEWGGKEVAVKVQRPGALESVSLDIFIMRRAVTLFSQVGLHECRESSTSARVVKLKRKEEKQVCNAQGSNAVISLEGGSPLLRVSSTGLKRKGL